jgi:hypothetical protein
VCKAFAIAALTAAALLGAPHAAADPDQGGRFHTHWPRMLCQIDIDDSVWCQGAFPQAPVESCDSPICPDPPMRWDLVVVSANGEFHYGEGNIGVGDAPVLDVLQPGQTWRYHGWTMTATDTAVTITNDASGHGMTIDANGDVHRC